MSSQILEKISNNRYFSYLADLYQRNQLLLTLSAGIFLGSILIGVLFGYFSSSIMENFLKTLFKSIKGTIKEITTGTIFTNNLQSAFFMYVGGVIVIVPIIVLSFNGFILGGFFGCVLHGNFNTTAGVFTPWHYIAFILPHGIFELPALIIAGAAGFRISTLVIEIIKSIIRKTPLDGQFWKFKDSLSLMAIAIVLLFIAAIIEANFTGIIGSYLTGLQVTST